MKTTLPGLSLCTGQGVRVAVLDSGVNPSVSALRGRAFHVFECASTPEGLAVRKLPPGLASDRNGHGTIVQSCVFSVAAEASVDHFRLLDENNQCDSTLLCYVLDHVVEQGYKVINLSLGTRSEDAVPWLVSIMKRAYERDVVIVASASNVGNALYPARFTYCISVEAASLGGPLGLRYLPSSVIEFAGHGVEVSVPWDVDGQGQPKVVTGSSYAAAHVSGLCARVLEHNPVATPLDVKLFLREYARSLDTLSRQKEVS
ncbi:MAG: S8 family serine peptidase [Silvanigrellales bacterium]|jgi:subtilisin|nr:S8 family serine peptidase [Silvanigrellales bacterium]